MDGSLTPQKEGAAPAKERTKPRMRAALRKAIDLMATKGMGVGKAAEAAGMNASALSRALAREGVREALDLRKAQFCLDADKLEGMAKAMAIQTGIDLMLNSPSDQVKARMVELFRGGRGGPLVNISIPAAQEPATGYRYQRPSPDQASGVEDAQVIDGQAQSPDVGE